MAFTQEELQKLNDAGYKSSQQDSGGGSLLDELTSPAPTNTTATKTPDTKGGSVFSTIKDVGIGAIKGAGETLQNIGDLPLKAIDKVAGTNIVDNTGFSPDSFQPTNTAQKVGKFGERVAEFAVPGSKIDKAFKGAKGLGLLTKYLTKAATSASVATAQEGEVGAGTIIAGATEMVSPVVTGILGRLFKGLGSGLSGSSTNQIGEIIKNPQKAIEISKQITKNGQESVLENNAKVIVNGISQIKKEAGTAFRQGLDSLKTEDIKPQVISNKVTEVLKKNKIEINEEGFNLDGADFMTSEVKNRATQVINKINDAKDLSGTGVRKLMDSLDRFSFKSVGQDADRMAFNKLIIDLKSGIKNAISESTNKLDEINAKYSSDLQIAENMERIFGDVKFKNVEEVAKAAQKLESFFSQKGLNPRDIDNFLTRIGINPSEFKTSEAVRQMVNKTSGVNATGLSGSEIIQQATSAIITPSFVKNVSIATGLAESVLKPVLEKLSPVARGAFIKSLMGNE